MRNASKDLKVYTVESKPEMTVEQYEKQRESWYNSTKEKAVNGYDCPRCLNRGDFLHVEVKDGVPHEYSIPCDCQQYRDVSYRMMKSGVLDFPEHYTFDTFKGETDHHTDMMTKSNHFIDSYTFKWLWLGGQVGSGKTHMAIAIAKRLIEKGEMVEIMRWQDEANKLKGFERNAERITRLKNARIIVIDDIFKTHTTDADVKLAFEIIDYRYNKGLSTIITSEKTMYDMQKVDEALYSRFKQKCIVVNVIKDDGKDMRL